MLVFEVQKIRNHISNFRKSEIHVGCILPGFMIDDFRCMIFEFVHPSRYSNFRQRSKQKIQTHQNQGDTQPLTRAKYA